MRHLGQDIKRSIAPVGEKEGRETRASLSIFKGAIRSWISSIYLKYCATAIVVFPTFIVWNHASLPLQNISSLTSSPDSYSSYFYWAWMAVCHLALWVLLSD